MSMHLCGPGLTTTKSSKSKKKLSDSELRKMEQAWQAYNKEMRRFGMGFKTLDEYIAYRQGRTKPKLRGTKLPDYQVSDHRTRYPSSGDQVGYLPARPAKTYSGTLVKGIATMHKSNAVPIISEEQAIEVSRMRRG